MKAKLIPRNNCLVALPSEATKQMMLAKLISSPFRIDAPELWHVILWCGSVSYDESKIPVPLILDRVDAIATTVGVFYGAVLGRTDVALIVDSAPLKILHANIAAVLGSENPNFLPYMKICTDFPGMSRANKGFVRSLGDSMQSMPMTFQAEAQLITLDQTLVQSDIHTQVR